MAKVKNQDIKPRTIIYMNGPHDPAYMGPQYRGILNQATPQGTDSDTGIVKKTTQGQHPTARGYKKVKQGRARAAFTQCTRYFSELPLDCDDAAKCYTGATKDSIDKLKKEFGIKCSYIDLFMRCCTKILYTHSGEWGPNLVTQCAPDKCDACCKLGTDETFYTVCDGGTLLLKINSKSASADLNWIMVLTSDSSIDSGSSTETYFHAKLKDNQVSDHVIIYVYDRKKLCFTFDINVISKCPEDTKIGYTVDVMSITESQELTAIYKENNCGSPIFHWQIMEGGGGSLDRETGDSVIYTAPTTNADCLNNPTIQLLCNEIIVDSFEISINGWPAGTTAYEIHMPGSLFNNGCWIASKGCNGEIFYFDRQMYDCYGIACGGGPFMCTGNCTGVDNGCSEDTGDCVDEWHWGPDPQDYRTPIMKQWGCCPKALM
jgi:hypothetical protein